MVITDAVIPAPEDGTATPSGDADDDFFASWDKPAIKRPTPPTTRTVTPPVIGRNSPSNLSANANGNANARPKSPLAATENASSAEAPPATRTTSSSAIRKSAAAGGARKANVLGAKRAPKLGAKKVTGAEAIDFEEAERKAREEAERAEKLGYNPEAEAEAVETEADTKSKSAANETSRIASPTPISPKKPGVGVTPARERSGSDIERLGMGIGRLGFGQVGAGKSATAPPAPTVKKLGFGATGQKKTGGDEDDDDDENSYARKKFAGQKGISSDEYFGRDTYDPSAKTEARSRLQNFEGSTSISSNAYFGRSEDDHAGGDEHGGYGDIESAARDAVRRFGVTAGDDLEHLRDTLGEGASKLQSTFVICLYGSNVYLRCLAVAQEG